MQNIMTLLQGIEIEPIISNKDERLRALFVEINFLLLKIKFCNNINDTTAHFDTLDKIQLILATLQHKLNINLPHDLKHFVTDFNDLYDANERKRLFFEIKQGEYISEDDEYAVLGKVLEEIDSNPIKSNISWELVYLEKVVRTLLAKIKDSNNIQQAEIYFDILQNIQDALAKLSFKYDVKLSASLNKFVSDFDRLDDHELRDYLFNKIKHNLYSL